MNPATRILIEQIGRLGYRMAIARDHVEALSLDTGERFIVRGDDIDGMADELAQVLRANVRSERAEIRRFDRTKVERAASSTEKVESRRLNLYHESLVASRSVG